MIRANAYKMFVIIVTYKGHQWNERYNMFFQDA